MKNSASRGKGESRKAGRRCLYGQHRSGFSSTWGGKGHEIKSEVGQLATQSGALAQRQPVTSEKRKRRLNARPGSVVKA